MSFEWKRLSAAKATTARIALGTSTILVFEDLDRDRGDQPDHAGGDPEQERPDPLVLGDRDELAVEEIGNTNAGRKMPRVIASAAGETAGHVADEGREMIIGAGRMPPSARPSRNSPSREPAVAVDRGSWRNGITV